MGCGRQFGDDAVFFHEIFKVRQFGIDFLITLALGVVDIIQLPQDDIEGLGQGIEMDDFLSLSIAAALDAEIGINEQQRFDDRFSSSRSQTEWLAAMWPIPGRPRRRQHMPV